jgi:hypothetical protein
MNIVTATNGKSFDLDSVAQTFTYNENGTLNYLEITYRGSVYRQTFTYNGNSQVTSISGWVKQ